MRRFSLVGKIDLGADKESSVSKNKLFFFS